MSEASQGTLGVFSGGFGPVSDALQEVHEDFNSLSKAFQVVSEHIQRVMRRY